MPDRTTNATGRTRTAFRIGLIATVTSAAISLGMSTALAAETISQDFPAKPPGVGGTVSGAVGSGPYDLTIFYGTPEGQTALTTIQGNCVQTTCPVQDTPTPEANETLVSAAITGTSPVFFEVS